MNNRKKLFLLGTSTAGWLFGFLDSNIFQPLERGNQRRKKSFPTWKLLPLAFKTSQTFMLCDALRHMGSFKSDDGWFQWRLSPEMMGLRDHC